MSKWPASWRIILTFVFCGMLCGCLPMSESPLDEEKDPNFIEGRNHLNMMDYKGAIEGFERAVQANPRNAAAHFELGILYQDRMNDPLSAAYHYHKHLLYRPKSEYRETINSRLTSCKMELAKTVTFGVVTAEVHRDLAKLTNEIVLLKQQNNTLRGQLAAKPMVVTQWMTLRVTNLVQVPVSVTNQAPQASRQVPTNYATRPISTPAPTNTAPRVAQGPIAQRPSVSQSPIRATLQAAPRRYVVRAGETMSSVARRHGITLQKLQAANPTVQPRNLRAGQTLNIPPQ